MCEVDAKSAISNGGASSPIKTWDIGGLIPYATFLCNEEGIRRTAIGFIGYNAVYAGDKVLIAVDSHYDPRIPETIAKVLRDDKGARVDIVVVDVGEDRPSMTSTRYGFIMRREHYRTHPWRYGGFPWIEELAVQNGYERICQEPRALDLRP